MKKTTSISIAIIMSLAFLLIAASPAGAAGYIVNAVQLNRSNQVIVFIETGSSPYFEITTTVSGFSTYYTACSPNGNNVLACIIYGQIAQQHPNQTAYIIMNANDDKAWFVVPEAEKRNHCLPTRGIGIPKGCCQQPGFTNVICDVDRARR